jgi:hypothetical protein
VTGKAGKGEISTFALKEQRHNYLYLGLARFGIVRLVPFFGGLRWLSMCGGWRLRRSALLWTIAAFKIIHGNVVMLT